MSPTPLFLVASLSLTALTTGSTGPVISEIMFQPQGAPAEDPAQEWIELYNNGPTTIHMAGWTINRGVTFTFPAGTTLAPGAYLVIAADVAVFQAAHAGFTGQIVGGWAGRLSNSGEEIQLDDDLGNKVNDVSYANEGDWAVRVRQPVMNLHQGWEWNCDADATGKTLELINPALGNGCGQNWGVTAAAGGTPGAANSIASTDVAPLIKDVKHRPEIPKSTEPIVISCNLEDETTAAATLFWRLDAGTWQALAMTDTDADGDVEATIPTQANLAIIEWYISSSDGVNTRTWPALARTSNPGVTPQTYGQVCNALVQVDNAYDPNATFQTAANNPIYRMILTAAGRNELVALQSARNGEEDSDAMFNATFISHDGTGLKVRYRCGVRNRGQTSRSGPPNNYHIDVPADDTWNGRRTVGINCRYPYSQALGAALYARAGIPPQDTAILRARLNGADMALTDNRQYGRYVRIEGRGSAWAEHHFPHDPDGNFYRIDYHYPGAVGVPPGNLGLGEFRWEGLNPLSYADVFIKENNTDANDYSDLINFCRVVSASPTADTTAGDGSVQPRITDADYPAAVGAVLDLDEFYRFIVTDALIGNQEGGLQSGGDDDASMYRGMIDTRIKFIPHDLDTVFDIGDTTGGVTRNIFSYDGGTSPGTGVLGLTRLFNHPQLVPRYYAALLDAMNKWFNNATIDPIVDQIMAGWVPATDGTTAAPNRGIQEIKAFVTARRTNVLNQIQQNNSLTVTTAAPNTAEGYKQTTTGAATFSGTFHVARTYSITVNGQLAALNYRTRTSPAATAGTWSLAVPTGGGGVLRPGLNKVTVQFWDAPNGAGNVLQTYTAEVLYNTPGAILSGTLATGSLRLMAPANYIPGVPFVVRVDLLDGQGNLDRAAWDSTATLTATGLGTVGTVNLYNGMGSALVTLGGGGGQADETIFPVGSTWYYVDDGGDQGTAWRAKDFPAETGAPWKSGVGELGAGDDDETTVVTRNGTNAWPTYYYRRHFTLPDPIPGYSNVKVRLKCDDGAIIYVNGTQVAITVGMTTDMAYNVYCTFSRTPTTTPSETGFEEFDIPLNLLVPGDNTIAVEVHNSNVTGIADTSFDMEMFGRYPSSDPGTVTLSAASGSLSARKVLPSLGVSPTMTTASGAISSNTSWSGVVNVTGDVTVASGATLTIEPGTHVLVDGTPFGSGGSGGFDIIVASGGALNAPGTHAQPISITCSNAANRWGEINFQAGAGTALFQHCLISRACHSPGGGHTGTGPMVRLAGTTITFDDCVLSDSPGKTLTNTGNGTITFRRTHCARGVMGPELDASALLIEDSNFADMLDTYRESGAQDDEDGIYIHDSGGRPVVLRRSVFANCKDDAVDGLAGSITIEDCIIRDAFDKGLSLLRNDTVIRRTRIIDCDIGISSKTDEAHKDTPYTTTLEGVTIVCEEHPLNVADGAAHSTGIHTRNKYGTTGANLPWIIKDTIISANVPVANDYGVTGNLFPQMTINYTCYNDLNAPTLQEPVPAGTGNLETDPLYVSFASNDFHLAAASPARDAGDPASPPDPDSSRADMGALPYGATAPVAGTITWTAAGGPYYITDDLTVPVGLTLVIQPGTSVHVAQNKRITVNGRLLAQGTPGAHIVFSHLPGTIAAGDCDPIKNGTQTGPPKWGGLRIVDSLAQENIVAYADFINAQGTSPSGSENYGSLGFIRSWGWADHCTWSGSHLRWCYGRNAKITVTHCVFPDMFDATEAPPADFIAGADNNQEPLKMEYPASDPELTGNPNFVSGFPVAGWCRVYSNDFYGNKGHNDVFDGTGGRVGTTFPLDCRYNWFRGLTGDEHLDLDGDCYIASNIMERGTKDQWTSDTGYSNAISTGSLGAGTTMMIARNLCFDMDHLVNCKSNVSAIVEHNTIANLHADFHYSAGAPYFIEQDVKCSVVNMLVPNDGPMPGRGDGCYLGYNIISNVPRLISHADMRQTATDTWVYDVTTKIEFRQNHCDQIADTSIGANHPGTIYASAFGTNTLAAPLFADPANKNFALKPESPARNAGPAGLDLGWTIPEWAYLAGGPRGTTAATTANFTVGGPGLIAYKWRLDGGAWSAPVTIGNGAVFDLVNPTVRTGTIALTSLAPGPHTLEVLGMDFAGNWQDADPAKTYTGQTQFVPTTRTWTVDPAFVPVRLSEILAHSATLTDTVELQNLGAAAAGISGWSLTDDPLLPNKLVLGGSIPAGGFVTFTNAALALDQDSDTVYLYRSGVLVDSIAFGHQIADKTIGRHPATGAWTLCTPTLGAANTPLPAGDYSSVRISEWFASGNVLYDSDWIELQNTNTAPVALTGMRLTTQRGDGPAAYTFPALSFLAGSGFLRVVASGDDTPGHLPFKLDSEYETVSLLNADGSVLDAVAFYPQTTDYSMGRGAGGTLTFYELPTRGFINGTDDPAYANALAILRGLRITEIMYNAAGGNDYEYVELRNVGATALQLAGVKFVNGIDYTFPTTTLNPGQNVLVVKNLTRFRQRYGAGPNVAGSYAGQLDNSGEGLALQLPVPFDANLLTFSFADTWQVNTDGKSKSLVVVDPLVNAGVWGDRDTWIESASPYGDPGGFTIAAPDHLTPWLSYYSVPSATDDSDHDGMSAFLEFALGTHPATASNAAAPTPAFAGDRLLEFHFRLPENPTVTQIHGQPGVTYAVQASDSLAGWTTIATKTATTSWIGAATVTVGASVNGFIPVTVRDVAPAGASRFMRLQVSAP